MQRVHTPCEQVTRARGLHTLTGRRPPRLTACTHVNADEQGATRMDEAAPQAASGKAADEQALEVLRLKWGHSYRIGHDDVRGWWARRRDGLGADITAGT